MIDWRFEYMLYTVFLDVAGGLRLWNVFTASWAQLGGLGYEISFHVRRREDCDFCELKILKKGRNYY